MGRYVALLRGVNIAGNSLAMERLRSVCCEIGWTDVQTYVQSGNVLFSSRASASACEGLLERTLVGVTKRPVSVFVRTPTDLKNILDRNPFREIGKADLAAKAEGTSKPARLYVTFLCAKPSRAQADSLTQCVRGNDAIQFANREIYVCYGVASSQSKLTNNLIEKVLQLRSTMRNWSTVTRLHEMATAP